MGLVSLAQLISLASEASPSSGISSCISSSCMHLASLLHVLSLISSHCLSCISSVRSLKELHSHFSFASFNSSLMMSFVRSSCLLQLSTCLTSSWAIIPSGVGYSRPPCSFGNAKIDVAVCSGRCHATLYACIQIFSSSFSSPHDHSTSAAEYLNSPAPLLRNISIAHSGVNGCNLMSSFASLATSKTFSLVFDMSPFLVLQKPRYLTDSVSSALDTSWSLYFSLTPTCSSPSTMMTVFCKLTLIPLHLSNCSITFVS